MNKNLRFFNYDAALAYYEGVIDRMRQGSVGHDGLRIIAKPVLILSVIEGIKSGRFKMNRFDYDALNELYEPLFKSYFMRARQESLTSLCHPFYFLQTDGFWHLTWKQHAITKTNTPSKNWIMNNVTHAYIDEELWILIANNEYAERLKDYVLTNKIKQPLSSLDEASEQHRRSGFRTFLSLLVAI